MQGGGGLKLQNLSLYTLWMTPNYIPLFEKRLKFTTKFAMEAVN